jgi:MFS family permease
MKRPDTRYSFLSNAFSFIKRQHHDWKVTVARISIDRFVYQMLFPYLSIYIVTLGATATQLGLVNSIGLIVAGLLGPLTGWFIDRTGAKKVYLIGIALVTVAYLTYAIAHSWTTAIVAMAVYQLGAAVSIHSCATICGNCLVNKDRATGMMFCETIAAGLLGMAGPMVGAWLVTKFGGVNLSGIRPLFFFSLIGCIASFTLILTQLSNRKWFVMAAQIKSNFLKDILQVFKEGKYLKRWLVISSVAQLPMAMVFPFSQVFAKQIKGADSLVLGAIVTACALTSIVFAVPLGRLADKLGRKKALYLTIPLFWLSNLALIWSPNTGFLIAAGILQGFNYIGGPISASMERELVPAENMGRWIGILRLCRGVVGASLAFLAGIIWDKLGPQYVFLTFIGLDLVLRVPLLLTMPETLRLQLSKTTP